MTRKLYIDGGINYDVENKAGVQILSSLPITSFFFIGSSDEIN